MNTLHGRTTLVMKVRETVARNLRIARNDRQLSQEELGLRANVHRTYIGMLEREEYNPTIEMLEKLAAALDLKVVDFFKTDANQ